MAVGLEVGGEQALLGANAAWDAGQAAAPLVLAAGNQALVGAEALAHQARDQLGVLVDQHGHQAEAAGGVAAAQASSGAASAASAASVVADQARGVAPSALKTAGDLAFNNSVMIAAFAAERSVMVQDKAEEKSEKPKVAGSSAGPPAFS
eukprot:TRINITY_DN7803_c0_g2_i9.p1 TRINITY_DN7803_c0_g2~~TRINITY_DN7803_c0_g2_i9.p1  ORF type:complete len:150 (+),score=42.64 TRINITY_DN7803_c0_g2_i9:391-840(+)